MESRFSFSSIPQPYRRESPTAMCSEEERIRKEEIEEKRMKQKKKMVQSCTSMQRWMQGEEESRRRWIEREEKESPSTKPEGDATTGRQGTQQRQDSATFEVLLTFAKFADLFPRPVVVVVKRFNISLRYNHDLIIDFAMNDRVTTRRSI